MRAYRPSRFGRYEEPEAEADHEKQANMARYARRAREGLPLFEEARQIDASASRVQSPVGIWPSF